MLVVALASLVAAALAVAVAVDLLRRRFLVVVVVDGQSMTPAYHPGDRVLVARARLGRRVRPGRVVVVEEPDREHGWDRLPPPDGRVDGRRWYIKRVVAVPGDPVPAQVAGAVGASSADARVPDGRIVVLGDNADSEDSRTLGYFPLDRVLGVVVRRLTGP
jgi:signal peptidase I